MTGPFDQVEHKHRDGVPWHEAPIPPRWHKCRVQTSGWVGFTCVLRCACGAISEYRGHDGYIWDERNSRQRPKRETMTAAQRAALLLGALLIAMDATLIVVALAVPEATTGTLITGMMINLGLLLMMLLAVAWPRKEQ